MSELDAGTIVDGHYEILALVGSGGLGTVYRARDVQDGSTVAVKMLNISGDTAQRRFLREFNILSRIRHPRIVVSRRWGIYQGKPYFSMDYVDGRPLSDLISRVEDRERLKSAWLLQFIRQTGEGLAFIHKKGVLHRDLKPSNIIVSEINGKPEVTILDLGLARLSNAREERLTPPGAATGTMEYIAPEQIRGRPIDQRSDLYSFGVILYEILTGKPPFTAEDQATVMLQHLRDLPRPPRTETGGIVSGIEATVMRLLEKEPIDRYSSIGNLLNDLTDREECEIEWGGDDARFSLPCVKGTRDVPVLQHQFQGRESEMKALREILREVGEGKGRRVLVSGEAGIGKSHVLEEFQADARVHGIRVLTGRCYESGERAYRPFLEALLDFAGKPSVQSSKIHAAVKRAIAQIEQPAAFDQTDPYQAMEVLAELLRDISQETPTLICIEDIQWADDLSLRFLDFMRREQNPPPLILALSCRKEDEDPLPGRIEGALNEREGPGITHLQLAPLSTKDTTNLIASMLGEQVIPDVEVRQILRETGGNPLFVVELIRSSIQSGTICRDPSGCWRWRMSQETPMPSGVIQAIESRLTRLRTAQRQALQYASIFRGSFSFDLISAVWRGDELQLLEALEGLVRLGLLRSLEDREGRYRFSHGLIQRAVYQGISEKKRELLHLEAGRALEPGFEAGGTEAMDELAYHFSRSNDQERMVRYVMASGRVALRMQDFSHALQQFEAVSEADLLLPDAAAGISRGSVAHLDFLCAYAEALCGCDRYEEARRELAKVMKWVSDKLPVQKAYALRMLGIALSASGDYEKAACVLLEALDLYSNLGETENELRVLGSLANVCVALNKKDKAVEYCHLAATKCRELGSSMNHARALIYLAFAAQFEYRNDRSKTLLDSSLSLMEREGDRAYRHNCLFLLGRVENRLGNFDRATEIFSELRDFWSRRGSRLTEAGSYVYLGRIALELGDAEAAEVHAREAERLLSDAARPVEMYRACALLAEVLAETGRVDEALAWAERAWPGVERGGNIRAISWTAKVKALAAAGRHDEVESLLINVSEVQGNPEAMEQINLLIVAGDYYLERGRFSDARSFLENAREAAEHLNLSHYAGKAARLLDRVSKEAAMKLPANELITKLSQKHLLTLYEASEDLTSVLDLNELLDRILGRLRKVSRAERVLIALKDEVAGQVDVARRHNLDDVAMHEISQGIIKWTMNRDEPVLSLDARADERLARRDSVITFGIRSVLCVPLRHVESGVIGALYMDHRELEGLFDEKDIALLSAFANLAAIAVVNARMFTQIQEQALFFREKYQDTYRLGELIGQSRVMNEVFKLVDVAAKSDMTVLIQGETGTGKELVARAIHSRSKRKAEPFLSANCGALTHELLQSELFGHKKGAFTGASSDRKGLFASAECGSVFLDEIGNSSSHLQSSLLRVLQDGETQRVGESDIRHVDVRVIAATNRELEEDVRNGLFREDLYYRLRVLQIEMPPLRERIEDVPSLSEHLLKRVCSDQKKDVPGFTIGAMRALMDHAWPGNVRELENEIRRAVALVEEGKEVSVELFSEKIVRRQWGNNGSRGYFKSRVAAVEKRMITEALDQCGGNISRAADHLGLSRNGLQKMMTRFGLR